MNAVPALLQTLVAPDRPWRRDVTEQSNFGMMPLDPHRQAIDRWCTALGLGDDDEVERVVVQSRVDRTDDATAGKLGTMLGGAE